MEQTTWKTTCSASVFVCQLCRCVCNDSSTTVPVNIFLHSFDDNISEPDDDLLLRLQTARVLNSGVFFSQKFALFILNARCSSSNCFVRTPGMCQEVCKRLLSRLQPQIYSIYKQVVTHARTIDPNFLGHPSISYGLWSLFLFLLCLYWKLVICCVLVLFFLL